MSCGFPLLHDLLPEPISHVLVIANNLSLDEPLPSSRGTESKQALALLRKLQHYQASPHQGAAFYCIIE